MPLMAPTTINDESTLVEKPKIPANTRSSPKSTNSNNNNFTTDMDTERYTVVADSSGSKQSSNVKPYVILGVSDLLNSRDGGSEYAPVSSGSLGNSNQHSTRQMSVEAFAKQCQLLLDASEQQTDGRHVAAAAVTPPSGGEQQSEQVFVAQASLRIVPVERSNEPAGKAKSK